MKVAVRNYLELAQSCRFQAVELALAVVRAACCPFPVSKTSSCGQEVIPVATPDVAVEELRALVAEGGFRR